MTRGPEWRIEGRDVYVRHYQHGTRRQLKQRRRSRRNAQRAEMITFLCTVVIAGALIVHPLFLLTAAIPIGAWVALQPARSGARRVGPLRAIVHKAADWVLRWATLRVVRTIVLAVRLGARVLSLTAGAASRVVTFLTPPPFRPRLMPDVERAGAHHGHAPGWTCYRCDPRDALERLATGDGPRARAAQAALDEQIVRTLQGEQESMLEMLAALEDLRAGRPSVLHTIDELQTLAKRSDHA